MFMELYLLQNQNSKSPAYKKYYAYRDPKKTYSVNDLAAHMSQHNTPHSRGTIKGVLDDMVSCIRELVLEGNAVKIDNLAIFKASVENSGGWESLDKVDLSIGGTKDNIRAIRLHATATGEFSKTELTGDAELTLTRDWREKVQKAKKDVQPEPQPDPQPDPQQDPQQDPQPGDEEW
jgi:hypothetical protein